MTDNNEGVNVYSIESSNWLGYIAQTWVSNTSVVTNSVFGNEPLPKGFGIQCDPAFMYKITLLASYSHCKNKPFFCPCSGFFFFKLLSDSLILTHVPSHSACCLHKQIKFPRSAPSILLTIRNNASKSEVRDETRVKERFVV